jgi:hypothetical protein
MDPPLLLNSIDSSTYGTRVEIGSSAPQRVVTITSEPPSTRHDLIPSRPFDGGIASAGA